ncbi:MAG: glycosyltransferase [Patescibacteria group bacterium]
MSAEKFMVFYDYKKRRKIYFRIFIISIFVSFIALTLNAAISIATTQIKDTNYDYNYYFNNYDNKKLALTFDDGPSPVNTLKIIKILKEHDVPATFFFIGENIFKNPQIVQSAYDAGIELGNHSFTHSWQVHKSQQRLTWELNATDKLIKNITGRSAILYRPPYLLDVGSDPIFLPYYPEITELWALNNGFITVGADIDPGDWKAKSPDEIKNNLKNTIDNGHIILLHDGGPEMDATVKALPDIITEYKAKGYEFVTLASLLGLTQEEVMPIPLHTKSLKNKLDNFYLSFIFFIAPKFFTIMWVLVAVIVFKLSILLGLLISIWIKNKPKSDKKNEAKTNLPNVSVIIPAYNEEKGIGAAIKSVLNNTHQPKEIIVIDDGSTDQTCEIVKNLQRLHGSLIKLIQVENGGKSVALNIALGYATNEIVICMDGDTIFGSQTIANLIKHFNDDEVGAVAGKVRIVRPRNLLAAFQGLEYITGQNIEKKTFNLINAVGIIPGPVGAWRKSLVLNCGGYSNHTLVEDQDLTLAILKTGKKIIYEPKAIGYTEAPATINDFIKQRFRWIFGTIQCFWKYRSSLFSKKQKNLGWIILPNIFLYNICLPLFSPLIDIIALVSIFTGSWLKIIIAYNLFTFFDVLYAGIASWQEKQDRHLLLIIPFQRLFYRQLIFFVVLRGIIKAIEGTSVFWNKIERSGELQKQYLEIPGQKVFD